MQQLTSNKNSSSSKGVVAKIYSKLQSWTPAQVSKLKQNNQKRWSTALELFGVLVGAGFILYVPEVFASDIAKPITKTLGRILKAMDKVGKSITAVSGLAVVILFIMGKPQYKWAGYVVIGGAFLASFTSVSQWILLG